MMGDDSRKIEPLCFSKSRKYCEVLILCFHKHTTVKSHKLTVANADTNNSSSLYINFEFNFQ